MPEDIPVVGMNLMPLEAKLDTPKIFVNFRSIGRGAAAICFRGKVRAIFHDVFPERGKSFDETVEIIKNYFPNVEIVNTVKRGIAIGEINGLKPVDFLSMRVRAYKSMDKDTMINRLEKGKYQTVSPYGLAFISRETHGCSTLGLYPHPVSIYPSLFELDVFYDTALFCGEIFRGGITSFSEPFESSDDSSFNLIIIDHNTIPIFGRLVHKIVDLARESMPNSDFLFIFSLAPSMKNAKQTRMFMSEIEKNIMIFYIRKKAGEPYYTLVEISGIDYTKGDTIYINNVAYILDYIDNKHGTFAVLKNITFSCGPSPYKSYIDTLSFKKYVPRANALYEFIFSVW